MQNPTNIRPIRDQVLVKQDGKQEKVGSGILYAPQGSEDWPAVGTVIAIGLGAVAANGQRIPMEVAPGDRVLFKRRPASALLPDIREFESGERKDLKDFLMLHEDDLLAVLEVE